jgi:hypothetical protein
MTWLSTAVLRLSERPAKFVKTKTGDLARQLCSREGLTIVETSAALELTVPAVKTCKPYKPGDYYHDSFLCLA